MNKTQHVDDGVLSVIYMFFFCLKTGRFFLDLQFEETEKTKKGVEKGGSVV